MNYAQIMRNMVGPVRATAWRRLSRHPTPGGVARSSRLVHDRVAHALRIGAHWFRILPAQFLNGTRIGRACKPRGQSQYTL